MALFPPHGYLHRNCPPHVERTKNDARYLPPRTCTGVPCTRKWSHLQPALISTTHLPLPHRLKWTYCLPHPHRLERKKKEEEEEEKWRRISIEAVWSREWERGLLLGEFRAKEIKILCDLASSCHGKEARAQGFEHLAHSAQSCSLLERDWGTGSGTDGIGLGESRVKALLS